MKILFILCFACLAVFSYAGEQERRVKFDSHNYCEALNKASALFSDTNPRSRKGKDPVSFISLTFLQMRDLFACVICLNMRLFTKCES